MRSTNRYRDDELAQTSVRYGAIPNLFSLAAAAGARL
jgi:hypothetical protein